MKKFFAAVVFGVATVVSAAPSTAVLGDLAAAMDEKDAESRTRAMILILERVKETPETLFYGLNASLVAGNCPDETSRLLTIWRSRPADLLCAELALGQAVRRKLPPLEYLGAIRETLKVADLPVRHDLKREIYLRQLSFYTGFLCARRELPAAAEFFDLLLSRFPDDPMLAKAAGDLFVKGCFLDTDTAPGMRNWKELAADNVWKRRLEGLRHRAETMRPTYADDVQALTQLAVLLKDGKLLRAVLVQRRNIPEAAPEDGELAGLSIAMKMPDLCPKPPAVLRVLVLMAFEKFAAAEAALNDVPAPLRDDQRVLLMNKRKDFSGIRNMMNGGFRPKSQVGFTSVAAAAEKLRDRELFTRALKMLPPVEKLDASLANTFGYIAVELDFDLPLAEKLIGRALALDEENFAYLDSMAWLKFKQKKYEEARKYIRMALRYRTPSSDVSVVLLHAADIELAASGDRIAARKFLERAERMATPDEDGFDRQRAAELWKLLK